MASNGSDITQGAFEKYVADDSSDLRYAITLVSFGTTLSKTYKSTTYLTEDQHVS